MFKLKDLEGKGSEGCDDGSKVEVGGNMFIIGEDDVLGGVDEVFSVGGDWDGGVVGSDDGIVIVVVRNIGEIVVDDGGSGDGNNINNVGSVSGEVDFGNGDGGGNDNGGVVIGDFNIGIISVGNNSGGVDGDGGVDGSNSGSGGDGEVGGDSRSCDYGGVIISLRSVEILEEDDGFGDDLIGIIVGV